MPVWPAIQPPAAMTGFGARPPPSDPQRRSPNRSDSCRSHVTAACPPSAVSGRCVVAPDANPQPSGMPALRSPMK